MSKRKQQPKSWTSAERRKMLAVDNIHANLIKYPVQVRESVYTEPLSYEIVREERVYFDKKRAFKFLELATFEGERPVRERHVQFLFDEYSAGKFLWHNVTLASAILGDKEYHINGQHTCWMRVNIPDSDEPIEDAYITERVYRVKDNEQLRALYSAFDRNAPRTAGHITAVTLCDTEAGAGIKPSYFRSLFAGFRTYIDPKATVSTNELLAQIEDKEFAPVFNTVGQFLMQHYGDHVFVRRSSVVGAMFATFSRNVSKSVEFWTPVCNVLDLTQKDDPRYVLRRYLESHGHSATGRGFAHAPQEVMYRICINAWNYWRRGETVTRLFVKGLDVERPKARQ